jgi:hypothetical protein
VDGDATKQNAEAKKQRAQPKIDVFPVRGHMLRRIADSRWGLLKGGGSGE